MTDVENALWSYRMFGDTERLEWVLRSGRPLSDGDRNLIADFIGGKIRLPRGRPPLAHLLSPMRIRNLPLRAAAGEVDRLKATLRKTGRVRGIHDQAIQAAVKQYCPHGTSPSNFEEKLRTLMRRPKRIRDST